MHTSFLLQSHRRERARPFKLKAADLHAVTEHVFARFRSHLRSLGLDETTSTITVRDEDDDGVSSQTVVFETLLGDRSKVGALPFQLVATRGGVEEAYVLHVVWKGPEDVVKETVRFLRTAIIEWSAAKERRPP